MYRPWIMAGALAMATIAVSVLDNTPQVEAQAGEVGAAAYYHSSYDYGGWDRIFWLQVGWGNGIPGAQPDPNGYWCVKPGYIAGQRLTLTGSNGRTLTCTIGDFVQVHHQSAWHAKWVVEVSYNLFVALGLHQNNVVTVHGTAAPVQPIAPREQYRFFEETGYIVGNAFLHYWEDNGGLDVFGYPLSDEYDEDGMTIQVFERAVFELHPDNEPEFRVLLRHLGAEYWPDHDRDQEIDSRFVVYWHDNGGLMIFGYPISAVKSQDGITFQVFERGVLQQLPSGVIIGKRLGAKVYQ